MTDRVGIVTVAYNQPELIRYQLRFITELCWDTEYEIVVADNSTQLGASLQIEKMSTRARYVKTNSAWEGTSQSHIDALLQIHDVVRNDYDVLAFFDHDIFPTAPFSIIDLLDGWEAVGVPQAGDPNQNPEKYQPQLRAFWAGFCMFYNRPEYRNLFDLAGNYDLGFDSGGNTYKLIEHVGMDRVLFVPSLHRENPYFKENVYDYYVEIMDIFVHFLNASAWNIYENNGQDRRIASLFRIIEERSGIGM